ncbi:MAG TPA: hypothetical protein VM328_02850, partial [Fimbriimonadaceae bacterium]|nr:hypothetical protein [Fimbriimonadaceae bacterium]
MLPFVPPEEAVASIKSGDRVFVHGMAAAPRLLLQAMTNRHPELRDVEITHLHTEGELPYARPEYRDSFFINNLFVGPNVRHAVEEGRADYIPVFLSEIPALIRKGVLPIDVALVSVSPPDRHGFCSLGVSVDATLAAVQTARTVIAAVNPRMPRTHGDGHIHVSRFAKLVEVDYDLIEHIAKPAGPTEQAIGEKVASLVEDGATLQMGIGSIPNAVLGSLQN